MAAPGSTTAARTSPANAALMKEGRTMEAMSKNLRVLLDVVLDIASQPINHFLRDVDVQLDHDRFAGCIDRDAPADRERPSHQHPCRRRAFPRHGALMRCAGRPGQIRTRHGISSLSRR